MKSKSKTTKNIDWRISSTGKPSKKYINFLKKAAKIQRDIRIKQDKKKSLNPRLSPYIIKELIRFTNWQYRSLLNDIKDYSKRDFWKTGRIYRLLDFIAEEKYKIIFTKKGTVSVSPQRLCIILLDIIKSFDNSGFTPSDNSP